jgi:AAA15 family ATPase/GTPase
MKITKISIKNYRSCQSTTFEPNASLTALIGPNGSGKTNVLSALKLLPLLCYRRFQSRRDEDSMALSSKVTVWFNIDGKTVSYTAEINLVNNERNLDEIIDSEEYWNLFEITGSKKRVNIPLNIILDITNRGSGRGWFQETVFSSAFYRVKSSELTEEAWILLQKLANEIANISYYSASQFTNPANCPISFEVEGDRKRRTGISITGHKKFLYDMYQEKRKQSSSYKDFFEIVGPKGIGLVEEIDFNEITTSSLNYSVMTGGKVISSEKNNLLVVPSFQISKNKLSPSQLSEGTFKTLALIFYLVTDSSPLLMIEEPEVCVHYGLLSSVVELIKIFSNEKQIFVSTHSDSVIDKLGIENVFQVKRDDLIGTTVSSIKKSMKSKELTALRNYLLNEGTLGELWKHGNLEND